MGIKFKIRGPKLMDELTNYNAIYSIAGTENENNLTFLMHESTLRTLIHQRISTNKSIDEINDQTDEFSDAEYI